MTQIKLPARADRAAAETLLPDLRSAIAGGDVTIDGADVTHLGQAMLQLLIAAQRKAHAAGRAFTLNASDAMRATLAIAGAGALADGGKL